MFTRRSISILMIAVLLCVPLFGQNTFMRTYDSIFCIGYNILPSNINNYTIVSTGVVNYGNSNLRSIRIDTFGDTLWTKAYGNDPIYQIRSVIKTPDNGNMICCRTTEGDELLIMKIDENDDSLWARSYGNGKKLSKSICNTFDSGAVITGFDENDDTFLLKIDSQGDSLWIKTYSSGTLSAGRRVSLTDDNGFIIGAIKENNEYEFNIWLIKTNSQGDTLWTRTYENSEISEDVKSVFQTNDGGYFILIATDPYSPNILAMRTDAVGDTLWTRLIGEDTGVGDPDKAIYVSDGGYLITAAKRINSQTLNIFLIKLNQDGDIEWTQEYGDLDNYGFGANDVIETNDYGFILTGSYSYNDGMDGTWDPSKLLIIKTDSLGQVLSSSIEEENIINNYILHQNYPNPFNGATRIQYALTERSEVNLVIYDITGRKIKEWRIGYQNAGTHSLQFDSDNLPSGIYLYSLQAGEQLQMKKMILLK